jgi:2-C-methyl-D-erythritol 4-phosphate cytidylyltransferase
MQVIALVPAAGSGTRMGRPGSKLLLELGGITLIERTLRALCASEYIRDVVLLLPAEERAKFEALDLAAAYAGRKIIHLVTGGATRQQSVLNGLEYCRSLAGDPDQTYIAVHDGARCLVSREIIDRTIEAAFKHGAVTAAVPSADSLKKADGEGRVLHSIDRGGVWAVQTPQVFKFSLLLEAHHRGAEGATDDAALVEAIHPVFVVEGARGNFKVTTPEDYELARRLVEW